MDGRRGKWCNRVENSSAVSKYVKYMLVIYDPTVPLLVLSQER